MRGGPAVLLLAGLAVLAGCGGVFGDVGPSTGPGPTTATPSFVAAPGITHDGVKDPARVARAHAASLAGQSYTVRAELTVLGPDGTERGGSVTVLRTAAGGDRFAYKYNARGRFPPDTIAQPDVEAYANGTHTFERQTRPNETAYRAYVTEDVGYAEALRDPSAVRRYLAIGGTASVERVDHRGWIAYRVRAAEPEGRRTVEAVVDTFGLVHELEATVPLTDLYSAPAGGTVRYTVSYSAVGDTTVEPPAWFEEARRVTRNQTYVGQG